MKLLPLIIAVILMSLFSDSIFAEDKVMELKQMDVTANIDQELIDLRRLDEETNDANQNASEKNGLLDDIHQNARELVPKQIAIFLKKQKLRAFYEARDKYMLCLENKNRNCSNLKNKYESELINQSPNDSNTNKEQTNSFKITNPYNLKKIRECAEVMNETFPGFMADIKMDITINKDGTPISAYINEDETKISHQLKMFSKCVEHFARRLNFNNETGTSISFKKNFIFGLSMKEG